MREELRSLIRPLAETVARRLVMTGRLIDEDPDAALAHAVAARRLASRVPAVREAAGIAAYHAGQWQAAAAELRTYQRITGSRSHAALLADCERALGRPERAIEIYRSTPVAELTAEEAIELLIVAAGARSDLGHHEQAVTMLQVPQLTTEGLAGARLRYAYADALLAAGDADRAREWFGRAVDADEENLTGAADRLLELEGVTVEEASEEPEPERQPEPAPEAERRPEPERTDTAAGSAQTRRLVDAYDLVLFDLDGVVYRGTEPVPHAVEVIGALRRDGPDLIFVTNNASRSSSEVAALLSELGIAATEAEVLTSAAAAAEQLARRLPPGSAVLVVGSPSLAEEVRRVGLRPVATAAEPPAAVLQGYGEAVGWADLAEACVAIRDGAQWVATNTDATLPSERGPLPGNGALVAALRTALDRDPDLVVGKPEPGLFVAAAARTGARRVLVVGDRLDTDVDGAHRAGMDCLLVRTGVDAGASVEGLPAHLRPTHTADDLTALLRPPPG